MKVRHKPKAPWPKAGTKRERKGYLWLPKRIGLETRWLEVAVWEEEVAIWVDVWSKERTRWTWEPTRWLVALTLSL